MLKYLRNGTQSTILKIFLFGMLMMAMAGLAMMDVQGMFRKGISSNGVIAKFKRGEITAPNFDNIVQSTLREKRIRRKDAYRMGLPRQILSNEIDKRLFSLAAYDMGLKIDDATALDQLKHILEPIVKQGATEKQALQRILRSYNLTEKQLVGSIKDQLAIQKLAATIAGTAYVPNQLIEDFSKYNNEWRRGEYFIINSKDIGEINVPSDKKLKAYYDTIKQQYKLPEYRTLSVMLLDKSVLGEGVAISQEDIKKYYKENIESFTLPANVVMSQAVISDEETAKKIYSLAKKEKSLEKAAKKFKGNFVSSDSFDKDSIMQELSSAAFAGKTGDILPPIKTPLGWDIISIEESNPASVDPLETVKGAIKEALQQENASDDLYKFANKIDDDIAGGKTLIEVAKEHNIKLKTLEKVNFYGFNKEKYQPYSGLPMYSKVLEKGFNLTKGVASTLIETDENSFVLVSAEDIFPPQEQSFEKIRSQILTRWLKDEEIKALSAKAAEVMQMIEKGQSFKSVAKSLKKEITSTQLIKRGSSKKETGTNPIIVKTLFALNKKSAVAPVSQDGAIKIIALAERIVKKPKTSNNKQLKHSLVNSIKEDLMDQFRIYLFNKYEVEVNDKLLNEIYNPNTDEFNDKG